MNATDTNTPHLLIIEDDPTLSTLLCEQLSDQGYRTTPCLDGLSGLQRACQETFQLILLDVLLPKLDGIQVLSQLRLQRRTPVIMLTARGAEQDRISGFRCGADDYLPKPFNITELILRIEAVLRRCQSVVESPKPLPPSLGALELNAKNHQASMHGQSLELTEREFQLLWLLAKQPEQVFAKAYLYQQLMHRPYSRYDRSLDMHISNLRRKLKAATVTHIAIQTVHGRGYRLHLDPPNH